MRLSQMIGERLKEKPADAQLVSHILLLRGGYIRPLSQGIYTLLTPALRILRRLEAIIRQEMEDLGGQEVQFPVVIPADLWQQSGRLDQIGSELVRFQDRSGRQLVLGMTHEEAAVHLGRSEARSHSQYPFMIYQIQTKFRDEPRSRGGLIRVREFTMKDAYSFHLTQNDCAAYYQQMLAAYERIFKAAGLTDVLSVDSATGMMGGKQAHEFMFLSENGEDSLACCTACDYRANLEVAGTRYPKEPAGSPLYPVEAISTPGVTTIADLAVFLSIEEHQTIKAAAFRCPDQPRPLVVFLRGDRQVSEAKLQSLLGCKLLALEDDGSYDLCLGFIGPYKLPKQAADVLFDQSLADGVNLVCGGNQIDTHLTGISLARDLGCQTDADFSDLSQVKEGDACPHCGKLLAIRRGIEVGNIFQLGDRYTKSMQMTYTDEQGKEQFPFMGCYGIGLGRLLACLAEQHHDDKGPIWPAAVAPWDLHICLVNSKADLIRETGEALYQALSARYAVMIDDRPVSAGIQFADADLLGVPLRLVVGQRNLSNNQIELVERRTRVTTLLDLDVVISGLYDFSSHLG